jgi:hypothetical protein
MSGEGVIIRKKAGREEDGRIKIIAIKNLAQNEPRRDSDHYASLQPNST